MLAVACNFSVSEEESACRCLLVYFARSVSICNRWIDCGTRNKEIVSFFSISVLCHRITTCVPVFGVIGSRLSLMRRNRLCRGPGESVRIMRSRWHVAALEIIGHVWA